jgi:hypothetical protein
MANYEALRDSVNKNGEVMIRLDTGESIEPHIHNVKFVDSTKEIVVDSGTQISWIGALIEYLIIGSTRKALRKNNLLFSK